MSVYDYSAKTLDGQDVSLADYRGKVLLIVNTASKCGFTPQYEGLEALYKKYADDGFEVIAFPCNQFGAQEPGSAEEIETFCSTTYGVSFPMMEKIDVNGAERHPIYQALTEVADAEGHSGDIRWNFEKFLIAPDGTVTRFSPMVAPEDAGLVAAIRKAAENPAVKAIVIIGADKTFVAGADIRELGKPLQRPFFPDVLAAIEALTKPVIAALHGNALDHSVLYPG